MLRLTLCSGFLATVRLPEAVDVDVDVEMDVAVDVDVCWKLGGSVRAMAGSDTDWKACEGPP